MRQLIESVLLSFTAAVVGLLFAYWSSRILVTLMSITLDVHPDLRVLSFTLVLAFMVGLSAGIAPAIGAARRNQGPALRTGYPKAMAPVLPEGTLAAL